MGRNTCVQPAASKAAVIHSGREYCEGEIVLIGC